MRYFRDNKIKVGLGEKYNSKLKSRNQLENSHLAYFSMNYCLIRDEQRKQAFLELLDELQGIGCRLQEDFEAMAMKLNRQKRKWEMPSLGELRSHFGSFLNQK